MIDPTLQVAQDILLTPFHRYLQRTRMSCGHVLMEYNDVPDGKEFSCPLGCGRVTVQR